MKGKMIWILGGIVLIVLLIVCLVLPEKENKDENLLGIKYPEKGKTMSLSYDSDNPIVAMYVANYGSIVMELYPSVAPNTVNSFISLVKSGYYDNNTIHRIDPDFVLQGGDPTGTGSGGPGYTIKGEFSANGFTNDLKHDKWVVSMGRQGNKYDSAGGQFFICLKDSPILDGQYAAFGRVIDGFENIEKMVEEADIQNEVTGKLALNLTIKKTVIDLKGKKYPEPEVIKK